MNYGLLTSYPEIYYSRLESSESFNSEVQGILSRLHDIMRTIPEPYRLDFSNKFLKVSRLSASLNMMLSQVSHEFIQNCFFPDDGLEVAGWICKKKTEN